MSVGVVFITHTAKHHLPKCLPPVLESTVPVRVLVVNSSSCDGTVELAREMGAETLVIPRPEFNQGVTREMARKYLGTDIVVMMCPDTYGVDRNFLEPLVAPLRAGLADVSYARQVPHDGAGFFEAFHREFNYGTTSEIRSLGAGEEEDPRLFFCSDSCAAWRNDSLDAAGGFPVVLTGEDTVATTRILRNGGRIAYVAEAVVKHSHRYGLADEFRRHFDAGYARNVQFAEDMLRAKSDTSRGVEYVRQLFRRLLRERPWLLPYAALQVLVKYLGYRAGASARRLPFALVRRMASQDYYWSSVHFDPMDRYGRP